MQCRFLSLHILAKIINFFAINFLQNAKAHNAAPSMLLPWSMWPPGPPTRHTIGGEWAGWREVGGDDQAQEGQGWRLCCQILSHPQHVLLQLCSCSIAGSEPKRPVDPIMAIPGVREQVLPYPKEMAGGVLAPLPFQHCWSCEQRGVKDWAANVEKLREGGG